MRVPAPDGLAVAVVVRGDGPALFLIHGFGGSAAAWGEPTLAALAHGRRVLAVDLIGHGASDAPADATRVALEPVLDDLERVLDAAGEGACDWVGYSMGGRIALAAALLRPARVRRLVLESASPGLADEAARTERRRQDEELAGRIEREGVDAWVEAWEAGSLFSRRAALHDGVLLPFLAARRANRAASLVAWLRGLGVGAQPSWWGRLGEVRSPTLLITGGEDERYTEIARRMVPQMRDARHRVVAGAGHTVHLEASADWLTALAEFLGADESD